MTSQVGGLLSVQGQGVGQFLGGQRSCCLRGPPEVDHPEDPGLPVGDLDGGPVSHGERQQGQRAGLRADRETSLGAYHGQALKAELDELIQPYGVVFPDVAELPQPEPGWIGAVIQALGGEGGAADPAAPLVVLTPAADSEQGCRFCRCHVFDGYRAGQSGRRRHLGEPPRAVLRRRQVGVVCEELSPLPVAVVAESAAAG